MVLIRLMSNRNDHTKWLKPEQGIVELMTNPFGVEDAPSLTALILATWQVTRVLAAHLIEAVLAARARQPTTWSPCPLCGALLRSKGFAPRQITSLYGPIQWQRRVGRCPQGCAIPQVAPFDAALGVQPHQRTSGEVQYLACALAVI